MPHGPGTGALPAARTSVGSFTDEKTHEIPFRPDPEVGIFDGCNLLLLYAGEGPASGLV